jgi:hypothetical protein
MQESSFTVPHWLAQAFQTVATLIAGGGILKFYNSWLSRRKPAAEVAEITVRTRVAEGDSVIRLMDRLELALTTVDRLRTERDGWQEQYEEVFQQKAVLMHQNVRLVDENKGYEQQVKRMARTLADKGLNYDGTQDTPIQSD